MRPPTLHRMIVDNIAVDMHSNSTGLPTAQEQVLASGALRPPLPPAGMADCRVVLVTARSVASLRDDRGQTL